MLPLKFVHQKILLKMKTKVKTVEKDFDTVKTFRAIKEKISKDISKMTLPQINEYLRNQKACLPLGLHRNEEIRYVEHGEVGIFKHHPG